MLVSKGDKVQSLTRRFEEADLVRSLKDAAEYDSDSSPWRQGQYSSKTQLCLIAATSLPCNGRVALTVLYYYMNVMTRFHSSNAASATYNSI